MRLTAQNAQQVLYSSDKTIFPNSLVNVCIKTSWLLRHAECLKLILNLFQVILLEKSNRPLSGTIVVIPQKKQMPKLQHLCFEFRTPLTIFQVKVLLRVILCVGMNWAGWSYSWLHILKIFKNEVMYLTSKFTSNAFKLQL